VSILQCKISPRKREQLVIDCFVLYALLNFMKTTSLIAVYLVGIFYHMHKWLMLHHRRLMIKKRFVVESLRRFAAHPNPAIQSCQRLVEALVRYIISVTYIQNAFDILLHANLVLVKVQYLHGTNIRGICSPTVPANQ